MKTPLGNVRGLGSAHAGTEHFWLQRLTAVANILLVTAFLIIFVSIAGSGHAEIVAKLSNPFVAILILAAFLSVLTHMRIGMQVIIEDYVHTDIRKIALLMANTFYTIAVGLIAAYAILKINFGL
jgi:succinate dehydrogenase / fumarate reductase membrane anchor subunit